MAREPKLLLFLGAGASQPLGLPTTREFRERLMQEKVELSGLESTFDKLTVDSSEDAEVIVRRLDETMVNIRNLNFIRNLDESLSALEKYLTEMKQIREWILNRMCFHYQLDLEQEKNCVTIYEPLFDLLFKSTDSFELPIFTTNYDDAVTAVANQLGTKYAYVNGFRATEDSVFPYVFDESVYNNKPERQFLSLFYLHGTSDLRERTSDHAIIKTGERGARGASGLNKRYERKDVFVYLGFGDYPYERVFSVLLDHFEEYLKQAEKALFIGFSFRDRPINLKLRNAFEDNARLHVLLLSTHANNLMKSIQNGEIENIPSHFTERFHPIQQRFGEESALTALTEALGRQPRKAVKPSPEQAAAEEPSQP